MAAGCLAAEEVCTLEACYVAAFRMKQRGLVMHEKLDKAAVSEGEWSVLSLAGRRRCCAATASRSTLVRT